MPSREQTVADAVRIFERADYPAALDATAVWMGVYQTLLWYEPINWLGLTDLPHIIDADKLRPASPARRRNWTSPGAWQIRAQAVSEYLAAQLNCPAESLPTKTDRLMHDPHYEGMQRQNTPGIAFAGLVRYVLERFGSPRNSIRDRGRSLGGFPRNHIPRPQHHSPHRLARTTERNPPRHHLSQMECASRPAERHHERMPGLQGRLRTNLSAGPP